MKRRWRCLNPACPESSWTEINDEIAVPDRSVTTRSERWATRQLGDHGRTVDEVARDLVCDWHPVNDTVVEWGEALLAADEGRFDQVTGLGLDETLFGRTGRWRTQAWATSIVDVGAGQLLDLVEGRTAAGPAGWLEQQSETWRAAIRFGVLELSGPSRANFDTILPHVDQIGDPFHLMGLANQRVDRFRESLRVRVGSAGSECLGVSGWMRGRRSLPLIPAPATPPPLRSATTVPS